MLNIIFFGMSGAFSRLPLEALLAAGYNVRAVVIPALTSVTHGGADPFALRVPAPRPRSRRALSVLHADTSPSIIEIAAERAIPLLEVARLGHPDTLAALASYQADLICVACFSHRVPQCVLDLPPLGCLNVHPSLLPASRGPDPLFWTFRHGDPFTGATVHLMDAGLDTGPILLQQRVAVPDGITEAALERNCAAVGGELLVRAATSLASGNAVPVPQDQRLATTYPFPDAGDYTIGPERSARWAYNFTSGIAGRGHPIVITTPTATFHLIAPLDYDATATLTVPWTLTRDALALQCSPGVFHARVTLP